MLFFNMLLDLSVFNTLKTTTLATIWHEFQMLRKYMIGHGQPVKLCMTTQEASTKT